MRIDRRLNIVLPVEHSDLGAIFVHSAPISRDVFERHFLLLSKAMASMFNEGLGVVTGPGVAALMLRKLAEAADAWDGPQGVKNTLMTEIVRLSNVVMPDPQGGGWTTMPLFEALRRGLLDEQDAQEAEDTIVFFICVSSVLRVKQVAPMLEAAGRLWNFTTTSLNSTEYSASLPISTPGASSGEKKVA